MDGRHPARCASRDGRSLGVSCENARAKMNRFESEREGNSFCWLSRRFSSSSRSIWRAFSVTAVSARFSSRFGYLPWRCTSFTATSSRRTLSSRRTTRNPATDGMARQGSRVDRSGSEVAVRALGDHLRLSSPAGRAAFPLILGGAGALLASLTGMDVLLAVLSVGVATLAVDGAI